MIYVIIAFAIVILGVIIFFLRGKSKYYGTIYSENHYTEIYDWIKSVVKLDSAEEPSFDNGTAFSSTAGCGFTFSRNVDEEDTIHIAISQIDTLTTHAVCGRIAFLIVLILNKNKVNVDLYFTESLVHHVILSKKFGDEWITNEINIVMDAMNSSEPLIFRFQPTQES